MTDDDGAQFRERLRTLTADIADLHERLDSIISILASNAANPAPGQAAGDWDSMNREHATVAWRHLTGWVDWLITSYELHEDIPHCWYRHRALLEELHALCLAWHGANTARGTGTTDRLYWHEHLDRALPRLRAWNIRGCTADTHRPATQTPATRADHRERDAFIAADLAGRTSNPQAC